MSPASIVVDMRNIRCGNCKVALQDEMAIECPVCGAAFDSVSSNHVGLAERLLQRRDAAGVASCRTNVQDADHDVEALVSS
jgi:hypothetical protein